MSRPVCFLDVDGVLADFWRGACAAHGRDYDVVMAGDVVQGDDLVFRVAPSKRDFWAPLDRRFWETLPVLPDAHAIVDLVERTFDGRVALLTSPPIGHDSVAGKLWWTAEHFPQFRRRTFVGPEKAMCAHPRALLVDDWEVQCDNFRAGGGSALLLPRPWNCGRGVADPVRWLADSLESLGPSLSVSTYM